MAGPAKPIGAWRFARTSNSYGKSSPVSISLNAAGLSDRGVLKVGVLDEQFRELPGLEAVSCTAPTGSDLRQEVKWGPLDKVTAPGRLRIRIDFGGVRPEDLRLYAIYVTPVR
jgi:hypothetical protein